VLAVQQIDAVISSGSHAVRPGRPARSVSVFVAAYNEAENLEPTVDTIVRALDGAVDAFEIIVVNDGSTDGTDRVADRLAAENPYVVVLHNPGNRGLGYGWMRAIEAARMASFVFIPGDNTWPYPSLRDLFGAMGQADVITSYPTNSEIRVPARRLLSSTYTAGLNLLFGLNLRYYHGLTIYPTEFLRSNVITTYGFASMAEALLRAIHHGYSYVAVPCAIEERATGRSNAVNAHNFRSVVLAISRLFFELRLCSRRGRTSTLGLFRPLRGAAHRSRSVGAASSPVPSPCGDV
jgi:glycosyltransferase involved in cell wall biosynthesis